MNEILLEFAGRMADAGATQLPESFKQLAVNAQFHLKSRMAGSDVGQKLDDVADYRLNLKKGRISLIYADGSEQSADAQVAGTLSDDGSFMWGWGHPDVPEHMQMAAWAVQQFGERQEIEELLSRGGQIAPERVEEFLAICAYISDADGVFRGDHGAGGTVCVCYYLNDQLKEVLPQ